MAELADDRRRARPRRDRRRRARRGVLRRALAGPARTSRELSIPYRIVFLEASDEDLVRRFEATRRRHPLAPGRPRRRGDPQGAPDDAVAQGDADLIIDTSGLSPHELRDRIRDAFGRTPPKQALQVSLVSFGYKFGVPRDADLVLDVRFLPNPHWVDGLRPLPGTDPKVQAYVTGQQRVRGVHAPAAGAPRRRPSPATSRRGSPT